jgi:TPR repeat protein
MHSVGAGVPKDPPRAIGLASRGCSISPMLCAELGTMLASGFGVSRDEVRAIELFDRACSEGAEGACAVLKVVHGGTAPASPESLKPAMTLWTDSCESGFAPGCSWLGVATVVAGDRPAGLASIRKGCSLGHAWGCTLEKTLGRGGRR